MGSPPFAPVSTVVTAISLSWVSSSVAAAPIVAATLVAFVRMPPFLVEAQLLSILLFIMFILVSCHDTVVSCFAVTISRHDFYRFPLCNKSYVALCAFGQPRGCRGNHLQRRGEYLGQHGGLLWRRGGYLGRRGEYLGQRREYLGQRGEYLGQRGGYFGRPAVGSRHYGDRRQSPPPCRSIGWSGRAGALGIWMRRWGLIASGSRAVRASRRAGCRHRRSPLRRAYVPGRWSCP